MLWFLTVVLLTDNISSFEGVYFLVALIDIAAVIGAVCIANMLHKK
jgi:hypothetical protein